MEIYLLTFFEESILEVSLCYPDSFVFRITLHSHRSASSQDSMREKIKNKLGELKKIWKNLLFLKAALSNNLLLD